LSRSYKSYKEGRENVSSKFHEKQVSKPRRDKSEETLSKKMTDHLNMVIEKSKLHQNLKSGMEHSRERIKNYVDSKRRTIRIQDGNQWAQI